MAVLSRRASTMAATAAARRNTGKPSSPKRKSKSPSPVTTAADEPHDSTPVKASSPTPTPTPKPTPRATTTPVASRLKRKKRDDESSTAEPAETPAPKGVKSDEGKTASKGGLRKSEEVEPASSGKKVEMDPQESGTSGPRSEDIAKDTFQSSEIKKKGPRPRQARKIVSETETVDEPVSVPAESRSSASVEPTVASPVKAESAAVDAGEPATASLAEPPVVAGEPAPTVEVERGPAPSSESAAAPAEAASATLDDADAVKTKLDKPAPTPLDDAEAVIKKKKLDEPTSTSLDDADAVIKKKKLDESIEAPRKKSSQSLSAKKSLSAMPKIRKSIPVTKDASASAGAAAAANPMATLEHLLKPIPEEERKAVAERREAEQKAMRQRRAREEEAKNANAVKGIPPPLGFQQSKKPDHHAFPLEANGSKTPTAVSHSPHNPEHPNVHLYASNNKLAMSVHRKGELKRMKEDYRRGRNAMLKEVYKATTPTTAIRTAPRKSHLEVDEEDLVALRATDHPLSDYLQHRGGLDLMEQGRTMHHFELEMKSFHGMDRIWRFGKVFENLPAPESLRQGR